MARLKVVSHYNLEPQMPIFRQSERLEEPEPGEPGLSQLEQVLATSSAVETFKRAVRSYCETGTADHIHVEGSAPRIKVRRVLTQVLAAEPQLPIERIAVRARSGCSDFVGTIQVQTASETRVYEFVWDCRWRAEQEGWMDCFGFPDQIRAAREYDWRCFVRWEPVRRAS